MGTTSGDGAIEALQAMGESSDDLIAFLKSAVASPSQLESCLQIIASGQVPPYGILTDPHHSTCFRIYHAQKFAEYLKKQG